jgi:hypothetical protein
MASTHIGVPPECDRIEALKLMDLISLKTPETVEFVPL